MTRYASLECSRGGRAPGRAAVIISIAGLAMFSTLAAAQTTTPTLRAPTSPAPERQPIKVAPSEDVPDDAVEDGSGLRVIPLKQGIKELRRIRLKHFGQIYNTEIRQLGIAKLREYNEPKFYPFLLEIFGREKKDVQGAVLDLLADQKDERADTTLAYAAIFEKDEWFRKEAAKRLVKRTEEYRKEQADKAKEAAPALQTPTAAKSDVPALPPGVDSGIPWRVKAVIVNGLKQKDDTVAAAAAGLAADLKVFDLIPAMINAQLNAPTGSGVGVGQSDDSALAYILVGQQQAFVSDLQPVVGDSAVAFDPQLSVATSGTVLRVIDAVVITYRTEIHYSLNRLANSGWDGRRTDSLGYDQKAWHDWYTKEFLPYRKAVAEGTAGEAPADPPQ